MSRLFGVLCVSIVLMPVPATAAGIYSQDGNFLLAHCGPVVAQLDNDHKRGQKSGISDSAQAG